MPGITLIYELISDPDIFATSRSPPSEQISEKLTSQGSDSAPDKVKFLILFRSHISKKASFPCILSIVNFPNLILSLN